MKLLALYKKELLDILTNKIYILIIFVQIFIVVGAFGLVFVTAIATDPSLIDTYGLSSNLKVGITTDLNGSELAKNLEDQKFTLVYYNSSDQATKRLGKSLVAVVSSSPQGGINVQTDNSNVFYPVVSQKLNNAVNKYQQAQKLAAAGLNQSAIERIQNPVNLTLINLQDHISKAPVALESSYFVEVMYGFIVPFVLLLPFFMASNIVTDSVVGERERKTFEVLLMAPLSSSMVMLGKTLPILTYAIVQSAAFIVLMDLLKVPIYNPLILLVFLFFTGLGFIGVGIIISMLVDSTKEANSAITLALVFATFILFTPLFIKTSYFEPILNFIPTVLMVKISSTPIVGIGLLLATIPTVLLSALIFVLSVRFFRQERAIRL